MSETASTIINDTSSGFSESFYITIIGVAMGAFTGFLGFVLKSRCTKIRCCGLECERSVLSEEHINDVKVEIPTIPARLNRGQSTTPGRP